MAKITITMHGSEAAPCLMDDEGKKLVAALSRPMQNYPAITECKIENSHIGAPVVAGNVSIPPCDYTEFNGPAWNFAGHVFNLIISVFGEVNHIDLKIEGIEPKLKGQPTGCVWTSTTREDWHVSRSDWIKCCVHAKGVRVI